MINKYKTNNNQLTLGGRLFLFCIVILLLPNSIQSATEESYVTYVNGSLELFAYCRNDQTTFCGASTTCNISELRMPNETILLTDQVMTRKYDGLFNFTSSLNETGDYTLKVVCTNTTLLARQITKVRTVDKLLHNKVDDLNVSGGSGDLTAADVWAYVIGSGSTANVTITDIYNSTKGIDDIGLLFASFFVSGLFMFLAIRQEGNQKPLKILFFVGSMLATILGLNLARVIAEDNGASANIVKLINTSYTIFIWVFLISFVMFIVYLGYNYIINKRQQDDLEERGVLE